MHSLVVFGPVARINACDAQAMFWFPLPLQEAFRRFQRIFLLFCAVCDVLVFAGPDHVFSVSPEVIDIPPQKSTAFTVTFKPVGRTTLPNTNS